MVLIDGIKYACQSCIKGHRSSKCTHNDRPLQEIKKKGRPTSQCTHCRELRKTKSVHGKCECAAKGKEDSPAPRLLPNGLSDAMLLVSLAEHEVGSGEASGSRASTSKASASTSASGVTRLLNPCNCLKGGKCTCCSVEPSIPAKKRFSGGTTKSIASSGSSSGPLSARTAGAGASSCCSSSPSTSNIASPPLQLPSLPLPPSAPSTSSCCSTSSQPNSSSHPLATIPSLALPPLSSPPPPAPLLFTPATHGTSSCFCGPTCSCSGCVVHDPMNRKRPAEGAEGGDGCGGGGCKCGMPGWGGGCGGKRSRVERGKEEGELKKGCCGSGGGKQKKGKGKARAENAGTGTREDEPEEDEGHDSGDSGVHLPALWTLAATAEEDVNSTMTMTVNEYLAGRPLPSLRSLWPALSTTASTDLPPFSAAESPSSFAPFSSTTAQFAELPATATTPAPATNLPLPSSTYFSAPESAGCPHFYSYSTPEDAFAPPCSDLLLSTSADASADDDQDLEEGCACSAECGCRRGLVAREVGMEQEQVGVEDVDAEGETDEEWLGVSDGGAKSREKEDKDEEERVRLNEVAERAAMGLFG
ncbi:hypothetical protein JCM11641_004365 [Rhodosporidiobolus odoratus]